MDIIINRDDNGILYSNESLLKGILHNTKFDGGFAGGFTGGGGGFIGKGARAAAAKKLGFSDHPTEAECRAKMTTFTLEAYPNFRFTLHKDLVEEVQEIYKELKQLGVKLTKCQGHFNYRKIIKSDGTFGNALSMHALGCAIDLNHDLNAYNDRKYKEDNTTLGIVRTYNSPIVQVFARHGWGWGGRYGDYMHFSKANGC